MRRKGLLKEILTNGLIIFSSYLLAVFIRYYVLDSEPGIDALSTPYLLIALVYSVLIACTFDREVFPRWLTTRRNINSTFQIITKNAIGCLLLLSAFYVTGIIHFSRWALFLFWIISSAVLLIKREIVYGRVARKRASGDDPWNVLIVGDGKLAKEYIRSITDNPQLGVSILGYLGEPDSLATDTDAIFDLENYPEPIIRWLGGIEKLEEVIERADEVILAEDDLSFETAKNVLVVAHKAGVKTSMSMHCADLIRDEAVIRDLGETKNVALNESGEQKAIYPTGMVITSALLLLIVIIRRFEMSAINTMRGFDSYRCLLFALFGFFLFLSLGNALGTGKKGMFKKSAVSWVICAVFIVLYELLYSSGVAGSIRIDLLLTTAVLAVCLVIGMIGVILSSDTFAFLN